MSGEAGRPLRFGEPVHCTAYPEMWSTNLANTPVITVLTLPHIAAAHTYFTEFSWQKSLWYRPLGGQFTDCAVSRLLHKQRNLEMAPRRKVRPYKIWTPSDIKALKEYSREKTPVSKIAKAMKRSEGTVRMKAYTLGMSVGHRRRKA
jgi:hypothetical protein